MSIMAAVQGSKIREKGRGSQCFEYIYIRTVSAHPKTGNGRKQRRRQGATASLGSYWEKIDGRYPFPMLNWRSLERLGDEYFRWNVEMQEATTNIEESGVPPAGYTPLGPWPQRPIPCGTILS